ncbi:phage head morphogenesis protein [Enterococcus plantarum]|uniref:Phage head morphogenesis protein n=1 Tax=Enterococcus plantarum TaxID=1077675 RepID=A0A2W3ZNP4_9ENTE|nr:minor capsid protein [Enterococcus plantarum]PZL78237.1 phage head morphogenesis protein [Enterococcus plantarum]
MVNRVKTRYPLKMEQSYGRNISNLINEIGQIALNEFDQSLAADIDKDLLKKDDRFIQDGLLDVANKLIKKVKVLSLGALGNSDANKISSKYLNGISTFSKTNVNSQLSAKGINPVEKESWLKEYMNSKIAENVSYITNIRDEYTTKFEQIIYRGVTSGQSSKEMRDELVNLVGMSEDRAQFIARDQTGSILGQLNAKRHQRAGLIAFIWSDSGDERVRQSHHERNGKIYYYADDPLLPGTDYGCRCVAEPLDDDEIQEYLEKENSK